MNNKEDIFNTKIFFHFLIPSVLSSLALALSGVIDSVIVGKRIGSAGLAAIGFGTPVYLLFSFFSMGTALGGAVHYARILGRGEEIKAVQIFQNTWCFVLIGNIVLSLTGLLFLEELLGILGAVPGSGTYGLTKDYVRAQLICAPIIFLQAPFYYFIHNDDNPNLAAAGLVVSNVVDFIFSCLFIGILHTGVQGSVWSTVLGACISIMIFLHPIVKKKHTLRFMRPSISLAIICENMKIGFATANTYIYQFIVTLLVNNILMVHYGCAAVAVFDMVYSIGALAAACQEGVGLTVQPMVSAYYSEQNEKEIKRTVKASLKASMVMVFICISLFCSLSIWLEQWFSLTAEHMGSIAVILYSFSLPFAFLNTFFVYYYQTVGARKTAYVIVILRSLAVPVIYVLLFAGIPLNLFWLFYLTSEMVTFLGFLAGAAVKKDIWHLDIDADHVFSAFICAKSHEVATLTQRVGSFCEEQQGTVKQAYFVSLAVDEVANTILSMSGDDYFYVQMTAVKEAQDFVLYIRDNSGQFNPFEMDTEKELQSEEGQKSLGMKIVKNKAKDFYYRRYVGFNTLMIRL